MPKSLTHKHAGGRPSGGQESRRAQVTRSIADRWIGTGHKAPLEVMLGNMEHFDQIADALIRKAGKWVSAPKTNEEWTERLKLIKSVKNNRSQAQECARDAAPYMHPKLQAIDHGQRDAKPWHIIMSPGDDKL